MKTNAQSLDYEDKFNECDARFEAIFSLTSAASKVIDSELTILKVNKALTDLMGYSSDELIGTKIMDYACEEDKPHWRELQKAMWKEGKPNFKLDACIIKKDKSLAWIHVTTIAYKENGIGYAFTVLDDFTGWKNLQESEQRLNMALAYSKMAVWELDLTSRSITRSDGFDQVMDVKVDVGWNEERLLDMFIPEDQIKLKTILDMIMPGNNFDFQGCIRTNDGIIKWVNLQGRAERLSNCRERVLGTLYDITRDKLAEREKDDFISIASHELKTPLTALKGSLQILERMKEAPTPLLPTLLDQAGKSMNKVTALVDELLNAGRLSEGQLQLRKTKFNLTKAIDECCLHVTAGGTHEIIKEGVQDAIIEADAERIQRVIVNLVNNAVKYALGSKEIVIRVEQESSYIKVAVIDKGPGIAAEKIPQLFNRYYRAERNGGQYSGLGLGLYISKEIIKKHGGEIGVDSKPGKGSSFWFTLPITQHISTGF